MERASFLMAPFTIDLRIDGNRLTTLTLRPFAGDLFVLYEVLAFKAYHIAPSLLPTDDVRVILDCGPISASHRSFLQSATPRATILSVEPDQVEPSRCEQRLCKV